MSWIKSSERLPPEDETILIHNNQSSRMELGRYIRGRWYVEDAQTGRQREVTGVTHWAWALDSQMNDESEDD